MFALAHLKCFCTSREPISWLAERKLFSLKILVYIKMSEIQPGKTIVNSVDGTINYSKSLPSNSPGQKWYIDTISCPNGTKICNFEDEPIRVTIQDLRGHENEVDFDQTGFKPLLFPSAVTPEVLLRGEEEVMELYYPEVKKLISKVTGANTVVFFDHTIRLSNSELVENPLHRLPVMRVHVDQTPKSSVARVQLHAPQFLTTSKRFQIINVWRPIGNTVFDYPLALADFRSLDLERDLEATDLMYPPWLRDKETFSVKYNPNHRWYYWSHMTPDEVMMFKCYDSVSRRLGLSSASNAFVQNENLQDVSGLCPHTAFLDTESALKGIRRQSIEVRALVFYD